MLNTLRRRLILSHVLPLLVMIPIMGIALVYVLETRVLLPNLSNELLGDALLIVEIARDDARIWYDPAHAQAVLAHVSPSLTPRAMFLDTHGHLLASSDPTDAGRLGQRLEHPGLANALAGEISTHTKYSQRLQAEMVDVWVPAVGRDQQVVGAIRLTHQLVSVSEQFLRLRYLIAAVMVTGLILGVAIGWVLALDLQRSLRRVTQDVYRLATGQQLTPLPEKGPEEIRLLSSAFNTLVERLRSLEQTRRQLLANLVHELGRPLGAMGSAIQALRSGAGEDVALRQELLAGMDAEARHLQRLLDDLARLYEQVLGTLELDRRPIALGDWLPHALTPWREAAQGKELHWQVMIPDTLPTLEIDPDRLAQVLGNLLSNAIKYTQPGGTVSASAGVKGEEVWIRVSDTGPGIAPEEQAHIFTPFYRGGQARRFPQGMGLGLSIARELVVAHGGRLELESTPGLGSHFTVWLPLKL